MGVVTPALVPTTRWCASVNMYGVVQMLSVRACGMCAGEEENSAGYRSRASGMERKEFCI